jgi:hypothetical protein
MVDGLRQAKLLAVGLLWITLLLTGFLGSAGWFDSIDPKQIGLTERVRSDY